MASAVASSLGRASPYSPGITHQLLTPSTNSWKSN